jgi:hypothetical protein
MTATSTPLTAKLIEKTRSDYVKVTDSDANYREAESKARSLIEMLGEMAGAAKSSTISHPKTLPYLAKVSDDLGERYRECVQTRQSFVGSLG